MKTYFEIFAAYNRWANRQLYEAVARLDEADFAAQRAGFFPSIARTLNHLLVADRIWLSRFLKEPLPHRALDEVPYPGYDALRAARDHEDGRIIAYIEALEEHDLAADLVYSTMNGDLRRTRLSLCLGHFFNHQTHHRGQAHAMLSGTHSAPPPLDLLYFVP
ncbi:MAG TPA: DinB family protein [Dongiaceae bacterium]|jgi:uncharacterized damage-inducible protein DinB|nr:DinB family protein [Dongiaceae bacterium]